MDIKVLGPSYAKCQQAKKVVREAVAEVGLSAQVGGFLQSAKDVS